MTHSRQTRIGVFGWGVVAPKSPNIEVFKTNLQKANSWLTPFEDFGPNNFLVGMPAFDLEDYRSWVDARFPPRQFRNLAEKMDLPTKYAVGAFIQALNQNPGIEAALQELHGETHVYIGSGLGAVDTISQAAISLYKRTREWNQFWATPTRNARLRAYLEAPDAVAEDLAGVPAWNQTGTGQQNEDCADTWNTFWTVHSVELRQYLAELAQIEAAGIEGEDVEAEKLKVLREKGRAYAALQAKWNAPPAPWQVSSNVIWNIHSMPAAQVSILGKIRGLAFAPCAACATFGVALAKAMEAIRSGHAKAVVIGATDPPPLPLTVGAFYSARVLAAHPQTSVPLTRMLGTHVAGGAVVWIVGDLDFFVRRGFQPLGMEPLEVGTSSDAHHIITPSPEGPRSAILEALHRAGAACSDVGTWDLHATATPGDFSEMSLFHSLFPGNVLVTARKGAFGHGMSAGTGWELTAQFLGYQEGVLFPTSLTPEALNPAVARLHEAFVFASGRKAPNQLAGKLSSGVGGVNACILSKPLG